MAVRILMLVAVLLGDPTPVSPSYEDLLGEILRGLVGFVPILLVSAAVLLTFLYLTEPNRFNRLRTDWLRTAWIGVGVLFFVMVVVPGALLIYQYSGIGD